MSNIQYLRNRLEQQKGQRVQIEENIVSLKQSVKEKQRDQRKHEQAREVIRTVGIATQQQLSYHISDITSLALDAVFNDPYKLVTEFVERRNKTECDLYFERDGNKVDPLSASGGGAVDVAAFALRLSSIILAKPRLRKLMVLDEPFKNISEKYLPNTILLLEGLAKDFKVQFIMVTHITQLQIGKVIEL